MAIITGNSRASLLSFLAGSANILIPIFGYLLPELWANISEYFVPLLIIHSAVTVIPMSVVYRGFTSQVALRGAALGNVFGLGLILSFSGWTCSHFGWYMTALSFFHWSEFMTTAITNPRSLSLESYLLDHSKEYHIAAIASWAEFFIEWFFFPGMKTLKLFSIGGLLLVVGGEVLRKLAMFTAQSNFNHYIQHVKEEGHTLVTHGIYNYFRHPSYVGWFYWSIGTQVMLCNPVCTIAYAYVSWKFFNSRIEDEEVTLLNFFGENYLDYQKRVSTGLPFITGYRMEL